MWHLKLFNSNHKFVSKLRNFWERNCLVVFTKSRLCNSPLQQFFPLLIHAYSYTLSFQSCLDLFSSLGLLFFAHSLNCDLLISFLYTDIKHHIVWFVNLFLIIRKSPIFWLTLPFILFHDFEYIHWFFYIVELKKKTMFLPRRFLIEMSIILMLISHL